MDTAHISPKNWTWSMKFNSILGELCNHPDATYSIAFGSIDHHWYPSEKLRMWEIISGEKLWYSHFQGAFFGQAFTYFLKTPKIQIKPKNVKW